MLLHGFITFLVFWRIQGAFSPPIWSEPSTGNHDHTIALLASAQALATQVVVVLPAGLGIDKHPPLTLTSFRHSWHNKLLSHFDPKIKTSLGRQRKSVFAPLFCKLFILLRNYQ